MAYELPETLPSTVDELNALLKDIGDEVGNIDAETATKTEVDTLNALKESFDKVKAERDRIKAEAEELRSTIDELKNGFKDEEPEPEVEAEPVAEASVADTVVVEASAPVAAPAPAPVVQQVAASAPAPAVKSAPINFASAGKAAGRTPAQAAPRKAKPALAFELAHHAPRFRAGQVDARTVAASIDSGLSRFEAAAGSMARHGREGNTLRLNYASLSRDIPATHMVDGEDKDASSKIDDIIDGKVKSLTAAGGWGALSEIDYSYQPVDGVDGLIEVPSFGTNTRGGTKYPTPIDDSALYLDATDVDFYQTEATNITGGEDAEKFQLTVPAATWEDLRFGVTGVYVITDILQSKGHPEKVQQRIDAAMKAHQHKVSKRTIDTIVAGSGSARVINANTTIGAAAAILNTVGLAVADARAKYRIPDNVIVTVLFPFWVRNVIRADLAYQGGQHLKPLTDAEIDALFTVYGATPQWLKDYQTSASGLPGVSAGILAWPSTVNFVVYREGTWFRAMGDVIDLGVTNDSTLLTSNKQVALFTEDFIGVGKRGVDSRLYTTTIDVNGSIGPRLMLDGTTGYEVTVEAP